MTSTPLDSDQIFKLLGAHSAQIDMLLARQLEHKDELEQVKQDVHAIRLLVENYMASVAGGWRVIAVIGAVITAVAAGIGWAVHEWRMK